MKRWKKTMIFSIAEVALFLVAHAILIRTMAQHDIVSKIFAGGSHIPVSSALLIILFLTSRFLAVLAMPGIILSRLGMILFDWLADRRGA